MRRMTSCLALAVLTVLTLGGCPSEEPEPTTEPSGPPPVVDAAGTTLTEGLVAKWMATRDDERIERIIEELGDPAHADTPDAAKDAMARAAADPKLNEAVKAHGFADAEEWIEVRTRVLVGAAHVWLTMMQDLAMDPESGEYKKNAAEIEEEVHVLKQIVGELSDEEKQMLPEAINDVKELPGMGAATGE